MYPQSPKIKGCIVFQAPPVLNCAVINSFGVVSGDLHQHKVGPELMIAAAGMTIKNNYKKK